MSKAWQRLRCSALALVLVGVAFEAWAQVDITSSPNIVGSGARALGMGGAFIAIADDATSASWNPGGLTQLERPEVSLVYDFRWNNERFSSISHPEMDGGHDSSYTGFNYASVVYPIPWTLGGRNLVLSLNYQRQYDFERRLDFNYHDAVALGRPGVVTRMQQVKYRQKGQLSSLSPAFGFEITQRLSLGVTLNIWNESLLPENKWSTETDIRIASLFNGRPLGGLTQYSMREKYTGFRGVNATVGALYRATDQLQFGMVYHTKFTADVDYEQYLHIFGDQTNHIWRERRPQKITFPCAIGLGVAYRFKNDKLTLAMDVTRREWDQFIVRDPKNSQLSHRRTWGATGQPTFQHDIKPTYTVRVGAEYVFVNEKKPIQNMLPSLRAGFFYDPEPASNRPDRFFGLGRGDGKPDDYYGITLGAGVLFKNRVNLDAAYIYRWGNNARKDTFGFYGTDAKVEQHSLYVSTVVYF